MIYRGFPAYGWKNSIFIAAFLEFDSLYYQSLQIMKNQGFLALLALCVLSLGCYKDQNNTPDPITIMETPDVKINTTVYGVVNDESDNPLSNYTISVDGFNTPFENEIFKLSLTQVNKKNQHISVIRDEQEIAFANVSLIENDYNKLKLKSFPSWEQTSLEPANTKIIDKTIYDISLANQQNNPLNYGLIEDESTLQQMGIWGRGAEQENYFLTAIAAFYYKNDQENNSININYHRAIPAGEKIGLFHLDNNFHQWVLIDQYSSSTITINSKLDGYYMLASYLPSTFIEGTVRYSKLPLEDVQLPIAYQNLSLTSDYNEDINVHTSANGRWSSFVPDEILMRAIFYSPCSGIVTESEEIETQNPGSIETEFSASTSSGYLPLSFTNVDCSGQTISNPAIQVDFGDTEETFLFGEETIDKVISSCGSIILNGVDFENNMVGTEIEWNTDLEDDLGVLVSCDSATDYSYLKINGEEEILPSFALSNNNGELIISAPDDTFRIKIKGDKVGAYEEDQVNIYIEDEDFGENGYLIKCENSTIGCGINDCYISHLQDLGDGFSRITFSGVLWMQTINNPTAGNYEVEGQIIIK